MWNMEISYLILKILICINQVENVSQSDLDKNFLEDAYLDTHQLIVKYKYEAETHFVRTEDDYILRLHRIAKRNGKPFLLMHGLFDTSAAFIYTGPVHGLGYYLSDLGYDVWMGNARGNRYSRNHTKLNPNTDDTFWDFSFHEIGIYDLPAMIDYVLNFTKFDKLFYVGHSQGTTSYFVMASKKPEYNKKIISMHALSPVAIMTNAIRFSFIESLEKLFKTFFGKDVAEFSVPPHKSFIIFCKQAPIICVNIMSIGSGLVINQFNMTLLPIIMGHFPSTCSTKQVYHYFQIYDSKRFCEFDFGENENMKIYRKSRPPNYNISKITSPIVLYYSSYDHVALPKDVEHLSDLLPNVQGKYLLKKWTHVDYIVGVDARKIVYKKIADEARKFIA